MDVKARKIRKEEYIKDNNRINAKVMLDESYCDSVYSIVIVQ